MLCDICFMPCFSLGHRFFVAPTVVPNSTKVTEEDKKVRDCADLYKAGVHKNGVYTIHISSQETKKVRSHTSACGSAVSPLSLLSFESKQESTLCRVTAGHHPLDECEWRVLAAAPTSKAENTFDSFDCSPLVRGVKHGCEIGYWANQEGDNWCTSVCARVCVCVRAYFYNTPACL